MSSHSPQTEVGELDGAAEPMADEQPGAKETLEPPPIPELLPEPCDPGRSFTPHQPAGTDAGPSDPPGTGELRLVLLGRAGSGKSAAGNAVLGREEFETEDDGPDAVIQKCEKRRGTVAGRQISVVNTPDWFSSELPEEEVVSHLSACAALSAPGPHAFLLCVAADRPAEAALRSLGPLEEAFGPGAVRGHALVLLTHSERLPEVQQGAQGVEDYIVTQRPDLVAVVEGCGDRFHVLDVGGGAGGGAAAAGGAEPGGAEPSVVELLEKVEEMVAEAGNAHHTSGLFRQAEARVRERQEEILKERRERRGEEEAEWEEEEEEREKARDEAERSAGDLQLDRVPALWLTHSSADPPSFLHSVLGTLVGWLRSFLKFVRAEALLGGVVRVLVGGPLGGLLGATVGTVATEVGKRKHLKKQ